MIDNLNYELIGMRIKERRLKMKLTQEAVAEIAEISSKHMSNIENGKEKPSLACLVSVANALETTTDHLLMDNVVAASIPNLLGEAKTLFDECTPDEIFVIVETSKALKKSIRAKNLQNPDK